MAASRRCRTRRPGASAADQCETIPERGTAFSGVLALARDGQGLAEIFLVNAPDLPDRLLQPDHEPHPHPGRRSQLVLAQPLLAPGGPDHGSDICGVRHADLPGREDQPANRPSVSRYSSTGRRRVTWAVQRPMSGVLSAACRRETGLIWGPGVILAVSGAWSGLRRPIAFLARWVAATLSK